jgi:hypothetical protein
VRAQEWGAAGEHDALPTPSTVAAQHALAESRQRRDERSLDKGAPPVLVHVFSEALKLGITCMLEPSASVPVLLWGLL